MTLLHKEIFVCLDIEATGLDPLQERIIEIAAAKFDFSQIIKSFDTLVDPQIAIPDVSKAIHNISQDMVMGKPKIYEVLPEVLKFLEGHILVGHGILFDIQIMMNEAKRYSIPNNIHNIKYIDTLRLARLYGESPFNSLKELSKHFNIEFEGAHRALNDVLANIEIFKKLAHTFTTSAQILKRLEKPIAIKAMPFGKHKGRPFSQIPIDYLKWAAGKEFDQDLLYSIRLEINNRKKKNPSFEQASNPFASL